MSNLGNIVSGIQGLASGNQQFFNPVQQGGGISPQQEDYTTYGYNENLVADASEFAGSGTGESTMATQAATGSRLGKAAAEGQISDVNAGAVLNANRIGEGAAATGNIQGQQTLSSLFSSLNTLATNALNQQGSNSVGGTSDVFSNVPNNAFDLGGTQSG